jgi:hypothetical protein
MAQHQLEDEARTFKSFLLHSMMQPHDSTQANDLPLTTSKHNFKLNAYLIFSLTSQPFGARLWSEKCMSKQVTPKF